MKDQDVTKVEFILMCNDNIVVQRFFNVKGYNPKAKNSLELYYFIKHRLGKKYIKNLIIIHIMLVI